MEGLASSTDVTERPIRGSRICDPSAGMCALHESVYGTKGEFAAMQRFRQLSEVLEPLSGAARLLVRGARIGATAPYWPRAPNHIVGQSGMVRHDASRPRLPTPSARQQPEARCRHRKRQTGAAGSSPAPIMRTMSGVTFHPSPATCIPRARRLRSVQSGLCHRFCHKG
jgi:hypothetical protein